MGRAARYVFTCALALFAFPGLQGCGYAIEADEGSAFPWVRNGSRMVFDFHPVAETLKDPTGRPYGDTRGALVLDLVALHTNDGIPLYEYEFRQTLPHWEGLVQPLFTGVSGLRIKRGSDGLRAVIPRSCDTGSPVAFLSKMDFIRVPNPARQGERHLEYFCEGVVVDTLGVEAVEQAVEVPAGTFDAFVLHSTNDRRKEYWSEAAGLLKIELFREDGALLGYYELASRNF